MILYFLPDVHSWTSDTPSQFGLDRVIDSAPTRRETHDGPSGGPGMLIGLDRDHPERIAYRKDEQTWVRRFGSEAWMGFYTDTPPGPLDLERPHQVDGPTLRLSDDSEWVIPRLRLFDQSEGAESLTWRVMLEQSIDQDPETGRLILGQVVRKYAEIWDKATPIADSIEAQILQGKNATIADDVYEQFPADLLNLNYRIDLPEIAMLRLLSTVTIRRITQLALDIDTLRRNLGNLHRRVIRSGTLNTESGATPPTEAAPIPTDPPSAS